MTELRITCPADVEAEAAPGASLPVTYPPPAVTGGHQPVALTCTPSSGSEFQLGTTAVACSAQDSAGLAAACSFNIVVRRPPRLSQTSFMAFGDSLTAGTTAAPVSLRLLTVNSQSYPFKLQDLLTARYREQMVAVANAGEPGEQAVEGARRFHSTLLSVRPTVVLLMEGTNDLFFFRDEGIDRAIPALDQMIHDAQTHDVLVFLATIPPQRPGGIRDTVSRLVPAFNDRIRALARDTGAVLVDVEPAILQDMSLIGDDDLHPTERGYQKIAEIFLQVIRERLEVHQEG